MIAFICMTVQDPDDKEYMIWLYEEFKNIMFYTAKKYIRDQATCEDIAQECIVKLIQKIESLEKELAEWKDKYYRAFADIDNLRKQFVAEV